MTQEQKQNNKKGPNKKHSKKHLRLIVIIIVITVTISFGLLFWLTKEHKTVDEQLAAIEAARAIPEAENAVVIYSELLTDPNVTSFLVILSDYVDDQTWNQVMTEPWRSKDYPRLAALLKEHQYAIDKLLEVDQYEECRYPISLDLEQPPLLMMDWQVNTLQWASLLSFAANNDVAEGIILALYYGTNSEFVNLGSGRGYTIKELVETLNSFIDFNYEFDPTKPSGFPRRIMDISLAKKIIHYNPTTSLLNGLKETWNWFKENSDEYLNRKNYFSEGD